MSAEHQTWSVEGFRPWISSVMELTSGNQRADITGYDVIQIHLSRLLAKLEAELALMSERYEAWYVKKDPPASSEPDSLCRRGRLDESMVVFSLRRFRHFDRMWDIISHCFINPAPHNSQWDTPVSPTVMGRLLPLSVPISRPLFLRSESVPEPRTFLRTLVSDVDLISRIETLTRRFLTLPGPDIGLPSFPDQEGTPSWDTVCSELRVGLFVVVGSVVVLAQKIIVHVSNEIGEGLRMPPCAQRDSAVSAHKNAVLNAISPYLGCGEIQNSAVQNLMLRSVAAGFLSPVLHQEFLVSLLGVLETSLFLTAPAHTDHPAPGKSPSPGAQPSESPASSAPGSTKATSRKRRSSQTAGGKTGASSKKPAQRQPQQEAPDNPEEPNDVPSPLGFVSAERGTTLEETEALAGSGHDLHPPQIHIPPQPHHHQRLAKNGEIQFIRLQTYFDVPCTTAN